MDDIYLSDVRMKTLKPVSNKPSGVNGCCYKYKNGVIKLFNYNLTNYDKENILSHLNKESKIILWPESLVFKKGFFKDKLKGYYMPMAKGDNLIALRNKILTGKKDVSFDEILSIYYDKFLPELKKEEVLLGDVKMAHVFLSDNISLTDTDAFDIRDDYCEKIYKCNLSQVNYSIKMLFDYIISSELRFNTSKSVLSKETFLDDMIKDISKVTDSSVNSLLTLNNYKRSIK